MKWSHTNAWISWVIVLEKLILTAVFEACYTDTFMLFMVVFIYVYYFRTHFARHLTFQSLIQVDWIFIFLFYCTWPHGHISFHCIIVIFYMT